MVGGSFALDPSILLEGGASPSDNADTTNNPFGITRLGLWPGNPSHSSPASQIRLASLAACVSLLPRCISTVPTTPGEKPSLRSEAGGKNEPSHLPAIRLTIRSRTGPGR